MFLSPISLSLVADIFQFISFSNFSFFFINNIFLFYFFSLIYLDNSADSTIIFGIGSATSNMIKAREPECSRHKPPPPPPLHTVLRSHPRFPAWHPHLRTWTGRFISCLGGIRTSFPFYSSQVNFSYVIWSCCHLVIFKRNYFRFMFIIIIFHFSIAFSVEVSLYCVKLRFDCWALLNFFVLWKAFDFLHLNLN